MPDKRVRNAVREIYFVQGVELKLVKIGVTNDTRRRLISMQTFSPDPLIVLGVQICQRGGALEGQLHRRFEQHRRHGEWFWPAPELLAYIEANTRPLDEVNAARAELAGDHAMLADIERKIGRGKERWMVKNGFGHLIAEET